jgi:BirA family transcriptional regulator, biotin operon repressor / biotin---[acetyl-CoA-carboxylase] ligase
VTSVNRIGDILRSLREKEGYVSGASIATSLGISRTAVWKYLRQLEELGYVIEHGKGQGYNLRSRPDKLYPWEIERHLSATFIGRDIEYKDTLDSTNALAFRLALEGAQEGTCVVAEEQLTGRGRLQRKWHSPYGKNIYVSVILRPPIHPSQVYPLTFISSLAVYDLLDDLGIKARLKWPNDVLVGKKKICGTLIELSTEADAVRFVVIGIGLNVNMSVEDLSEEIERIATSLSIEAKKHFERPLICGILLANLERYYTMLLEQGINSICRLWEGRSGVKGTYVEIRQGDVVHKGVSEGIDKDGAMLINENGRTIRVIAGDASI